MANNARIRLLGLQTDALRLLPGSGFIGPVTHTQIIRRSLSTSKIKSTHTGVVGVGVAPKPAELSSSPLARLPTSSILRSLFLSIFFTSPALFRPGLAVFKAIANSKSSLLNPDKNRVLGALIRPVVYDQFCAGRNVAEIQKTSATIKGLGFSGVVLCYGKEVQLDANNRPIGYGEGNTPSLSAEIQQWRTGNLNTLDMVGAGDWLGIKLSGAGLNITQALLDGEEAPSEFVEAMEAICTKAKARNCRIWIDAEQQCLQEAIDKWTYNMMRKWNRGEKALVFNTVQAYLKCSREKVQRQLDVASKEGWRSAIKLVRGAYISNDKRDLIHDTKADTDTSYNSIVEDLLTGSSFPVFTTNPNIQHDLILAGHNTQTIRRAATLATELESHQKLKVMPEFGQLQGMADDIGCELLQVGEKNASTGSTFVPRVYKCLTWGSIRECMQYLTRRLVENRGAADRMKEGADQLRSELWRRMTFRSS